MIMIILQHNVFFEDNALGLQYFWDILYKLSFNNKLSCNLLFWLTQSINPIFTDIFLECSASHGVGWNRHDAYIVRNESFNKSNNFKKEFGCRMCIYTKLFACITIVKELAQNRHFVAFSSKPRDERTLWNPYKIFCTLCGLSKGPITHHFEIITPVSLW